MRKEKNLEINRKGDAGKSRAIVYGAALLFSFIVGFSFLATKTSMQTATPLEILTYRYNFAAIAALVPPVIGIAKIDMAGKSAKRLMLTAVFYLGFMVFQAIGLLFATSIESGIIFAIVPIIAKLIAHYYLGEKGDWKQNAFISLSITAVIAMFVLGMQDFHGVSITGLTMLLLSSLLMALSNVFMRGVRLEFSPFTIAFAISLGGCLLFNGATLVAGAVRGEPLEYFAPLHHWEFVLACSFLGILSTMVTSLLMAYMLAHMEAVKATIFGNLSTAISIVAGVIFLKEPLYLYHIICTGLIIIGVIGTSLGGMSRPREEAKEDRNGSKGS